MQFSTAIPSAAFLALVTISSFGQAAEPTTWPQWRGPTRDCKVNAETTWPKTISGGSLAKSWSETFGPSYSGPIVSKNLIFVTETRNRKSEVVRALDRKTGEEVWKSEWSGAMSVPFFAKANGDWIRATPAFDGKRLYVAGIRDVLVCLDAATGKVLWRVDFVQSFKSKLPSFGCVSSPLLDGDSVYVQAGGGVVRLNKMTGKVIWHEVKDGGGMFGSAFSSPVIATIRNVKQLVVQTRKKLCGVDLKTGKVLWSKEIPAFRGMNILTPTVIGDRIFTSSYGGGSFLFEIDRNEGGPWSIRQVWKAVRQGYMSSPVVIDGHVYLHMRNRRVACIELKSGATKWISRPYGKYWSMVTQGDRILALDERGELLLIRANPKKFELIDRQKVSTEPTWAHLAICGSEVFVRGLTTVTTYQWNPEK